MNSILAIIVEDDPVSAFCLRNQLEQLNVTTLAVLDDPNDVQKISRFKKPDIVIMNIKHCNEIESLDCAKNCCKTNGIPVIFTSEDDCKQLDKLALEITGQAIMQKPILAHDLRDHIFEIHA